MIIMMLWYLFSFNFIVYLQLDINKLNDLCFL
ncbi:hypothetical protein YPC_2496 [Yersinia pestis biovar Medievalis str. Harbin 35]|nr:hypothetical protein YPC_2496 [Yersinia pestis biovar Medievalis str. Harbin 35]EEO76429.1 hypothetical protein YP516_2637 [Yersinia pestis Nepal516]EEO80991.1 hypothetical protein YPF_2297 [Yersinia pestis biovar Orientalis str. India 195]EEO83544.1 hypothetical protein YPH_4174 [Yersinia pestis biovar Orientalis str. PEXU2]EEO89176.1 hypothetical protein YPS_4039 [Yersinia pestis Pestoides A]ERP74104.1 hypothetical protein L327_08840 [Yersinia pestis S3]ERP74795.1 hypothetical protein L3